MQTFLLPAPPSTNALFFNLPKEKGGGRAKTKAYAGWIKSARWLLMAAKARPVPGKVRIAIELSTKSGLDLDNCLKPSVDLLVAHGIIDDDQRKFVDGLTLEWSEDIDGIRITILPPNKKALAA